MTKQKVCPLSCPRDAFSPQLLLVRRVVVAPACSLPPLSAPTHPSPQSVLSDWPSPLCLNHAFWQNSPGPGFHCNSSCLHGSVALLSMNILFENTGSPKSNINDSGSGWGIWYPFRSQQKSQCKEPLLQGDSGSSLYKDGGRVSDGGISCFSFCCYDKLHDQKASKWGKGCFIIFHSWFMVHSWSKSE